MPPRCLRLLCPNERWLHPVKGALCLWRDHAEAVFSGRAEAPPLRTCPDYVAGPRKAFLVSVPDDDPLAPSDPLADPTIALLRDRYQAGLLTRGDLYEALSDLGVPIEVVAVAFPDPHLLAGLRRVANGYRRWCPCRWG